MAPSTELAPAAPPLLKGRSDPWIDLGLTLPIFIFYHLGVVFLSVRNAADPVTQELRALANQSLPMYAGLTLAIGAVFVVALALLGRGQAFQKRRFFLVALEGTLYAVIMRFAGAYAVGSLRLASGASGGASSFGSLVMALGAGFYEEIAFRVGLFGVVAWLLKKLVESRFKRWALTALWAVVAASVFAGWHYVGALGDPFDLSSFVFRGVCGLVLTAVFVFRGFAPAVWTHAVYDVWVMVLG